VIAGALRGVSLAEMLPVAKRKPARAIPVLLAETGP
jgi:hypothetical protein